jgi:hypothetical protein
MNFLSNMSPIAKRVQVDGRLEIVDVVDACS